MKDPAFHRSSDHRQKKYGLKLKLFFNTVDVSGRINTKDPTLISRGDPVRGYPSLQYKCTGCWTAEQTVSVMLFSKINL